MRRSAVARGLAVVLVMFAWFGSIGARAQADTGADAAYTAVAGWMFERYLERAIAVTRRNAAQILPDADQAIARETPALLRFLARHRDNFIAELLRPLQQFVPATEIASLAEKIKVAPVNLDARALQQLTAVDNEFRMNSQRVLRAMTFELDLLVEQTLEQLAKPRN